MDKNQDYLAVISVSGAVSIVAGIVAIRLLFFVFVG
jgi:hypothetical protein